MPYLYIDGDGIGHKIESAFLENDQKGLVVISKEVFSVVDVITQYLKGKKQEIILSAADGIVCSGPQVNLEGLIEYIRAHTSTLTFSIGQGDSLSHAYMALRYAKAKGKDMACVFDGGVYRIMRYIVF